MIMTEPSPVERSTFANLSAAYRDAFKLWAVQVVRSQERDTHGCESHGAEGRTCADRAEHVYRGARDRLANNILET